MHSILGRGIYGWSGSIAAIPPGYSLCDGTNGTPDLRDRFITCAGQAYVVGGFGGDDSHSHDMTIDTHRHDVAPGTGIDTNSFIDDRTTRTVATATTDVVADLPTYYALAYLMATGIP